MINTEHSLACDGVGLPATLTVPEGPIRCAIVLLHPAGDGSRGQLLFRHLASVLPRQNVAVLRFDRRTSPNGEDVPYDVQSADLRVALAFLRERLPRSPIGLWGASQGAWIALRSAASGDDIGFLILVGCSAVSPADQMRFGTAMQLRAASFDDAAIGDLGVLRSAYEAWVRGEETRERSQEIIDTFTDREWFPLAWIPPALRVEGPCWPDMDFDPAPFIRSVGCPVLAFYGDDDWVPVRESLEIWQREYPPQGAGLTVKTLPRSGHLPLLGGQDGLAVVDPDYAAVLTGWLAERA